jgi:hypothetical protein
MMTNPSNPLDVNPSAATKPTTSAVAVIAKPLRQGVERLLQKINNYPPEYLGGGFIVLAIALYLLTPKSSPQVAAETGYALDQLIPAGYQLLPVEIANAEALNAVLEDFGIVDLYVGSHRIASGIKIIRGSNNSEQFSVLIPEDSVGTLVSAQVPFHAVIRNREHRGMRFEKRKSTVLKAQTLQIEHLDGDHP